MSEGNTVRATRQLPVTTVAVNVLTFNYRSLKDESEFFILLLQAIREFWRLQNLGVCN